MVLRKNKGQSPLASVRWWRKLWRQGGDLSGNLELILRYEGICILVREERFNLPNLLRRKMMYLLKTENGCRRASLSPLLC